MIEIKTMGGTVLYTAQTAADVREALVEAVKGGANLDGANLRGANLGDAYLGDANLDGANLGGANLDGANLDGANLRGANLGDANLRGAYLGGANLGGANLDGANLDGANLGGANLGGANLDGANLDGANLGGAYLDGADLDGANLDGANLRGANLGDANLDGAIWKTVADKLDEAVAAMNDSGRHWIQGSLAKTLGDGTKAYCAVGSIEATCQDDRTVRSIALWLLASVAGGSIESFNDYEGTSWEDVQALFGLAAKHARRFGAQS